MPDPEAPCVSHLYVSFFFYITLSLLFLNYFFPMTIYTYFLLYLFKVFSRSGPLHCMPAAFSDPVSQALNPQCSSSRDTGWFKPAGGDQELCLCTPWPAWETVGPRSHVWLCVCVLGTFFKSFLRSCVDIQAPMLEYPERSLKDFLTRHGGAFVGTTAYPWFRHFCHLGP